MPHTPEQIDSFGADGWITTRGGHTDHRRITARDRVLYEEAKRARYLTGGSFQLRDLWFLYCEARGWPYIVVRLGPKFRSVHVDFISVRNTPAQEGIFDRVWAVLLAWSPPLPRNVRQSGGDVCFSVDRIPREVAAAVAETITGHCIAASATGSESA
ncbi:MAG TPA: hypothetical protein VMV27_07845 [Candidatus Binataceae bacterium]|nr:hypothetical protein [Candidatus Binataceae bacterium]